MTGCRAHRRLVRRGSSSETGASRPRSLRLERPLGWSLLPVEWLPGDPGEEGLSFEQPPSFSGHPFNGQPRDQVGGSLLPGAGRWDPCDRLDECVVHLVGFQAATRLSHSFGSWCFEHTRLVEDVGPQMAAEGLMVDQKGFSTEFAS